jgi:hypothetical protein
VWIEPPLVLATMQTWEDYLADLKSLPSNTVLRSVPRGGYVWIDPPLVLATMQTWEDGRFYQPVIFT